MSLCINARNISENSYRDDSHLYLNNSGEGQRKIHMIKPKRNFDVLMAGYGIGGRIG